MEGRDFCGAAQTGNLLHTLRRSMKAQDDFETLASGLEGRQKRPVSKHDHETRSDGHAGRAPATDTRRRSEVQARRSDEAQVRPLTHGRSEAPAAKASALFRSVPEHEAAGELLRGRAEHHQNNRTAVCADVQVHLEFDFEAATSP